MDAGAKRARIEYVVLYDDFTLYDEDGAQRDENGNYEWGESPAFATLAEARAWMREQAAAAKVEVVSDTRYGNGTLTRPVYELWAYAYDEDEGEWVPCSYEGEPWKDIDNERLDVLKDLHPEMLRAWERANRSFCSWLDYADDGMGYSGLGEALECELGEGWRELGFVK